MSLVKKYFKDERAALDGMSAEGKAELADDIKELSAEIKAISRAKPYLEDPRESETFKAAVGFAMNNPKIAKAMKAMKMKLSSKKIPKPYTDEGERVMGPWIREIAKYVEKAESERMAATKKMVAGRQGR